MKILRFAAILSLMVPVAAFFWYWIARADYYFPGRYEDAFSGTAICLLVAMPGAAFLIVQGVRFLVRRARRDAAA
jgi:hypothetical protein